MARPLSTPPDPQRGGGSTFTGRAGAGMGRMHMAAPDAAQAARPAHDLFLEDMAAEDEGGQEANGSLLLEMEQLQSENRQLRGLCAELEQALHEASQQAAPDGWQAQAREYEALLEEKSEMIRSLHQQIQELQGGQGEKGTAGEAPEAQKPLPREAELLALSEELERERRQLQEDEETLMEQMREMEISMARERAEMARQRNDLQRLQSEIRHELERLERSGALQSKMENLKSKLQDATTRRGAAPGAVGGGLLGRMFGQGGSR